ncbi:MAG: formate dehydrogenase accessory sulfurtransferase FdhD [Saprospiraceae bacterium]
MLKIPSVTAIIIQAVSGTDSVEKEDFLAIEEPLEIWLEYGPAQARVSRTLSITMRTPGADEDLLRGFLLTEGIVRHAGEISDIHIVAENRILARLEPTAAFDMALLDRHFYTTSSCGVCGKTSIEALKTTAVGKLNPLNYNILNSDVIYALPDRLRAAQSSFELTGGLHASALFSLDGALLAVREDVGRHNALDKLIGHYATVPGLPLEDKILLLSGRASFELIQKAAVAGIPVVCAVGAPSSLAVATAQEFGIVLIGFLRGRRFNVYNG